MGLSTIVSGVLFRLIDGAELEYGDAGRRIVTASGSTGRGIAFLIFAAAVVCAVRGMLHARYITFRPLYTYWIALLVGWWLTATVLRGDVADPSSVLVWAGGLALLGGVIADPPTMKTVRSFAALLDLATFSALAYGLSHPEQQRPCRADKCGIFDSLFNGYQFQENAAARLIIILLPAAVAIRSRTHLTATLTLAGLLMLATASRTSQASYVAAVLLVLWLRTKIANTESSSSIPQFLKVTPAVLLVVSLWAFLTFNAGELTDRGEIFAGIRDAISSLKGLTLGTGADTVVNLPLSNDALAFGEHGQAPHVLVYAGVPGLLFFGAALLSLSGKRLWAAKEIAALGFTVIAATQYVTEAVWSLEVRNMAFAIMLLTAGLFSSVHDQHVAPPKGGGSAHSATIPSVHISDLGWILIVAVVAVIVVVAMLFVIGI